MVGDIQEEQGKMVVEEANQCGGEAVFVRLNVSKEENWARAVQAAVSRFGQLTCLINNAGTYWPRGVEAATLDH